MDNCYLYLHTYVFLWKGTMHWLFYDSLHGKQLSIPCSETVNYLFNELSVPSNFYSVKIDDYIHEKTICEVVQQIEKNKLGGIHTCIPSGKPIIIPPHLFFQTISHHNNQKQFKLDYLKEVTIHLSGECSLSCKNCKKLFHQFPFCTKNKKRLNDEQLRMIKTNLTEIPVEKINIIINDFRDTNYQRLISHYFYIPNALCVYYLHWRHFSSERVALFQGNYLIKVMVDISDVRYSELQLFFGEISTAHIRLKERVILVFYFSEIKEYATIKEIVKAYSIDNCEIHVYYNGNNEAVLKSMYFLSDGDLSILHPSLIEVLANRVMNRGCFGKIYIYSDGTVHLNENSRAIGNVSDPWRIIIEKAMKHRNNPWLSTRRSNSIVCRSCEYQDLCPPISNIELFMKSSYACSSFFTKVQKTDYRFLRNNTP